MLEGDIKEFYLVAEYIFEKNDLDSYFYESKQIYNMHDREYRLKLTSQNGVESVVFFITNESFYIFILT